jgi:hypothetical protein
MTKPETPIDSPLEAFIEARNKDRKAYLYDADTFLMKDGKRGAGKLRIRVPLLDELERAVDGANAYVKEREKRGLETNAVWRNNVEVAFTLNAVCRHPEKDQPAFRGPRWMVENFVADEFAVLHNLYEQTLQIVTPIDLKLDDEKIEQVAAALAVISADERQSEYLAPYTREVLAFLLTRTASKLKESRDEIDALRKAYQAAIGIEPVTDGAVGSET